MEKTLCACGCGEVVSKKGRRFRQGHWAKTNEGRARNSEVHFKGSKTYHGDGYVTVTNKSVGKHVLEHRKVAEEMIGRPLHPKEIVHHIDGDRSNNHPSNLLVLSDQSAHAEIHLRQRAIEACGHADWRMCSFCKKWDNPENLTITRLKNGKSTVEHRLCGNEYRRKWAAKKRECAPRKQMGHDSQGRFIVIAPDSSIEKENTNG